MTPRRLVVVGASAAGVAAAMGAREAGWDGGIVVVGAEAHQPYERPPLSKALLTGAEPHAKPLLTADRQRELDLELVLGQRVVRLDPPTRTVTLADGTVLAADGVVLATGARPRTLDGLDGDAVHVLRTLSDATELVRRFDGSPVAVVGGGFIGMEVAAAARVRGHEVAVIEAAPLPLLAGGGPALGAWFRARHAERGVRVLTSAGVTGVRRGAGGAPAELLLTDGSRVPAGVTVVGIGVVPRTELAEEAGLEVADGVVVDATGRTSHPWVYAAGDVANHRVGGRRRRVEHWTVAAEQGRAAGRSVAGVPTPWRSLPYFWSDQYDLTLQLFGAPHPSDAVVPRRESADSACWFWLRDGRVSAVAGVNCPAEIRAGRQLAAAAARVPVDVLADPAADLRGLGRSASGAGGTPLRV
ncbi:NAD(P)/FAD-dependent oxidoreductase [Blastococcus sp. SYSU D00669]